MELSERRINRSGSRLAYRSVRSAAALSWRVRRTYSCIPCRRAKILTHIQAERVSCNVTSGSPRRFVQAIVRSPRAGNRSIRGSSKTWIGIIEIHTLMIGQLCKYTYMVIDL